VLIQAVEALPRKPTPSEVSPIIGRYAKPPDAKIIKKRSSIECTSEDTTDVHHRSIS
jgi:hypothetical protein